MLAAFRRQLGGQMLKIDFGYGVYVQADDRRMTPFHKRIVSVKPIPNTRCGNVITLECGHRAEAFGNLKYADGVVLCVECRGIAQGAE